MKKCTYCGKEYPDSATACAIDGEALTGGSGAVGGPEQRKKITGVWRGVYDNAAVAGKPKRPSISFTLKLKQGWFGHFTGTVVEDAPVGKSVTGAIDGSWDSPEMKFIWQRPASFFGGPGRQIPLRDYIISKGGECPTDLSAPSLMHKGTFLDANRVQGTWSSESQIFSLPDQQTFRIPRQEGYWCAEFITEDLQANPRGGPAAPYFDLARLPPLEEELPEVVKEAKPEAPVSAEPAETALVDETPPGHVCVARLEPLDAKRLLNRLEEAAIPFLINNGEEKHVTARGLRKTVYIEIYVLTADSEKASQLNMADWKL